jgi:antitoxin component YwqK of YwqJK toxin-antitoxin module
MDKKLFIFAAAILFTSCASREQHNLSSVQVVDRNGMNETVSNPEKLDAFAKVAFDLPQPYQKIVRVYKKDTEGKVHAKATTYHDNGHIHQYLETVGGRAHGVYKEWFTNGKLRMQARVIEGMGDLTETAQATWIFDQDSHVWDQEGQKIADIYYEKGSLEGVSNYYYPNGLLSKKIPYKKDQIDGELQIFAQDGTLIGTTKYLEGIKHGLAHFAGDSEAPPREELYEKGYLLEAKYYNYAGEVVSKIDKGYGIRTLFVKGILRSEHEYQQGVPEGQVRLYREDGSLEGTYRLHEGKKEGEEFVYYRETKEQPMLCITWLADEIHGNVRTWYPNGKLESEREMNHNKKQGMSIAWYQDGSLMLFEEYENDVLLSGKYLKKGDEEPCSRIIGGSGCATLFTPNGDFLRKVEYRKGKPVE